MDCGLSSRKKSDKQVIKPWDSVIPMAFFIVSGMSYNQLIR
jgi:hypothetical protein